ncbi:MAG: hypothetical protein PHW09_13965 [Desulfovibrio desulfuricans]|nr:hypothetical protein [Desulfovibrio desulfuricans]
MSDPIHKGIAYKIHSPLFGQQGQLGQYGHGLDASLACGCAVKGFLPGKFFLSACDSAPALPGAIIHASSKNRNAACHLSVPASESAKEDHGPQMVAVWLNCD